MGHTGPTQPGARRSAAVNPMNRTIAPPQARCQLAQGSSTAIIRVTVAAATYCHLMGEPRPLGRAGAWWCRQRHQWDWTFDGAASAGDTTLRVRRQIQPDVTAPIRRLQDVGTGRWEGRRLIDRTGRMALANIAGVAVGYVYAVDDAANRIGWCLLDDVVVDPDLRNRGIGHALVAEMASWLHADGYTTLYGLAGAGAGTSAEGGLAGWYERMGFEKSDASGGIRADVAALTERTAYFRAQGEHIRT